MARAQTGTLPAAGTSSEQKQRAKQLVVEADQRFRQGDAASAIPLLEEAYQLGRWPGCLLNLAMAHHTLSHCEVALGYYRRYAAADPYSDRREEVAQAMQELESRCGVHWQDSVGPAAVAKPGIVAERAAAAKPLAAVAALPGAVAVPGEAALRSSPSAAQMAEARGPQRTITWSLLGAGAVSGLAAGVFVLASQRKNVEAHRFGAFREDDPRARAVHAAGLRYNRLAWGFGIAGAALLGAGATLLLLPAPGDGVLAVGSGPSLSYHGHF